MQRFRGLGASEAFAEASAVERLCELKDAHQQILMIGKSFGLVNCLLVLMRCIWPWFRAITLG